MHANRLLRNRPRAALVGIIVLCVGLPLLSAAVSGSIRIPHNDDWAYFEIVSHLADTGELNFVGWTEVTFVGQLLWAVPVAKLFGHSLIPIVIVNALISAGGLVLTYFLARRFLGSSYALLTALFVGIFPGFTVLVPTFMTDQTGYTAQLACLVLGLRALDARGKGRLVSLTACLAVGLYAFSVREFAIAAPVSVLIALFLEERHDRRVPALALAGFSALLVAAGALYWWRHTFPGSSPHFFGFQFGSELLVPLAQMFFTLSLGLVPVVLLLATNQEGGIGRLVKPGWFASVPLLVLALLSGGYPVCCADGSASVFLGNLLTEHGVLDNQVLPGIRPKLFPFPLWWILSAAAVVGGSMFAGRLRTTLSGWDRSPRQPAVLTLAIFGALTAGGVIFRGVLGGPMFDRYLTPLVLVAAIFLLRGQREPTWTRNRGAAAVTALLAVASLVLVSSGHTFDVARWEAARIAVASGIPAADVDGGFEWVGYHYDGIARPGAPNRPLDPGPGYLDLFPQADNCAVVAASPLTDPEFDLIDSVPYRSFLGLRVHRMWIYRFPRACANAGMS